MCCSHLWRLGLYYYNARWYDPNLGRFITEDPIKDGTNWYIYCSNNPLNMIDPTGLWTFQLGVGVTAGGGGGVTGEVGIGVSFSFKKGFDIALYKKGGVGTYMGAAATVDFSATVSAADEIMDMSGETITAGGSGNATVLGLPGSVGGEVSVPLDKTQLENTSVTATASIGPGTPGEAHVIYTNTDMVSVKSTLSTAADNLKKIPETIKNGFNDKVNQVKETVKENQYNEDRS